MAGVWFLQKMLNVQSNRTETLLQPLGHSDLESDNVPVLVNSTSSTPIRRTMLSSLQGQSEAGILDKPPWRWTWGLVLYYPNQTQQTEPGSGLNMDCLSMETALHVYVCVCCLCVCVCDKTLRERWEEQLLIRDNRIVE